MNAPDTLNETQIRIDLAAAIRTGFARIFPEDWGRRFEPCCAHAFSPRF